ncbi:MAG TPA: DUF4340 domain-containing protein [Hyphomicrobiaceae bacterium]|nr:DUF4340 domain-containing protein [Hyphomicrobiaceae bacterium]
MTPRSFVYLAAAAVVSAAVAIVTFAANNQWGTGPVGGARLMPTLENAIGQVAEVSIQQGDTKVVLARSGGSWTLKSRGGYPVDIAKVRTLLVGLGQAELVEPKTNRPDKYPALELEDPAGKGAKSRLVKLTDAKGGTIAEAVLGKNRQEGYAGKTAGTYVRKPGDPQTWLASVALDAPFGVKDWVKPSVLALQADKIKSVSVEIPGEQPLKIERTPPAPAKDAKTKDAGTKDAGAKAAKATGAKDAGATDAAKAESKDAKAAAPPAEPGKLAFVGFPADGKKLKDAYAAEGLARAAGSIDLEDVRKLGALPSDGISVVRIESANGLTTTLRLRKDGDAYWLSVTAAGSEGDAKKAADEITARTKDWEFKIPTYKAELILKKRADLLETQGS